METMDEHKKEEEDSDIDTESDDEIKEFELHPEKINMSGFSQCSLGILLSSRLELPIFYTLIAEKVIVNDDIVIDYTSIDYTKVKTLTIQLYPDIVLEKEDICIDYEKRYFDSYSLWTIDPHSITIKSVKTWDMDNILNMLHTLQINITYDSSFYPIHMSNPTSYMIEYGVIDEFFYRTIPVFEERMTRLFVLRRKLIEQKRIDQKCHVLMNSNF